LRHLEEPLHRHTGPRNGFAHVEPQDYPSAMSSLEGLFVDRTKADIRRLREMVESVRQGETTSALPAMGQLAHRVHGAAALFGYAAMSDAAGSIEQWAEQAMANTHVRGCNMDDAWLEPLLGFMQRLATQVE
jgi:HPt (histidine-containing phosphotransfer) domain-containing protein